jgi:hypothetical protein
MSVSELLHLGGDCCLRLRGDLIRLQSSSVTSISLFVRVTVVGFERYYSWVECHLCVRACFGELGALLVALITVVCTFYSRHTLIRVGYFFVDIF